MRRIILVMFFIIILLSACGRNAEEDLKSNIWNVVATNGEAYTAEFASDTVTFKMAEFLTVGMGYEINGDEITLIEEETNEEHAFTIEKNKQEYKFIAKTDEVRERFGDLTLSPTSK